MKPYLTTIIILWAVDQTYWSCCMDYRDSDFKLSEQILAGWLVRETTTTYVIALEQVDNNDVKHTVTVPKADVQAVRKYKFDAVTGALREQKQD